jgi:hypothetical protein
MQPVAAHRSAAEEDFEMRTVDRFMLAVAALALSSASAWAWGLEGHRSVGMVADLILQNDPAGAIVRQRLGASLSEAATWADCAKSLSCGPLPDEQTYVSNNHQHKTYHYTDVPIQQSEYKLRTAGTRNNDVVQVAKQSINILRETGSTRTPAALDGKSALWLLAHLVGDLHQPLHIGALYYDETCATPVDPNVVGAGEQNFGIDTSVASTNGGNDLLLPGRESFHVAYWDEETVARAMQLAGITNRSIPDFASYMVAHPPTNWKNDGDPETWPQAWATEIMPIAKDALTKVEIGRGIHAQHEERGPKCTWPVTITPAYKSWAENQALAQLTRAGFRLAALLREETERGCCRRLRRE